MTTCSKCGSTEIVPNVRVADRGQIGGDLLAVLEEHPKALLFKGDFSETQLQVCICGECGYCELFAPSHREVFRAYRRFSGQTPSDRDNLPVVHSDAPEGVDAASRKPA